MKNLLIAVLATISFISCSSSYNIKGTSDVAMLDGHMLYLKAVKDGEVKNIDSCDVVHGQFHFNGQTDTTKVGAIFLGEQNLIPVVLEEGDIVITINTAKQQCSGSELNDKLSAFTEKYNQLSNQMSDLEHQHYQAIMDGKDMETVAAQLQAKADKLSADEEKLITEFIEENFDNVLAPFVFQMVTGSMEFPMYTPWIEALLAKATDAFRNDPYVKEFISTAERNQAIMNGMQDATQPETEPSNNFGKADDAPTPNQLAEE